MVEERKQSDGRGEKAKLAPLPAVVLPNSPVPELVLLPSPALKSLPAVVLPNSLANTLLPDNGYVAVSFRGTLIEMSVPTLALAPLCALLM